MLAVTTLVNLVVSDMLHQHNFSYAHFPELVDLAVIGTGLGLLRSNIALVNDKGTFWDTTQWLAVPRPFLDTQALAYANAIAAWVRDEKDPRWAHDLPKEVKGPLQKSLKYLHKTNDSFFQARYAERQVLNQSQEQWWQLSASQSTSAQIVAVRHLQLDDSTTDQQQNTLVDKLRSNNRAIVLHAMVAAGGTNEPGDLIADEFRLLVEHRDDEIRAKALLLLTRMGQLDEPTIRLAAKMLESKARFVVFAGISALASLDTVSSPMIPAVDRAFIRSLQSCDYEFIGLFASAYQSWIDDPNAHFASLLQTDSPEYLAIATEALATAREQLIALG